MCAPAGNVAPRSPDTRFSSLFGDTEPLPSPAGGGRAVKFSGLEGPEFAAKQHVARATSPIRDIGVGPLASPMGRWEDSDLTELDGYRSGPLPLVI